MKDLKGENQAQNPLNQRIYGKKRHFLSFQNPTLPPTQIRHLRFSVLQNPTSCKGLQLYTSKQARKQKHLQANNPIIVQTPYKPPSKPYKAGVAFGQCKLSFKIKAPYRALQSVLERVMFLIWGYGLSRHNINVYDSAKHRVTKAITQ